MFFFYISFFHFALFNVLTARLDALTICLSAFTKLLCVSYSSGGRFYGYCVRWYACGLILYLVRISYTSRPGFADENEGAAGGSRRMGRAWWVALGGSQRLDRSGWVAAGGSRR